MCYTVFMNYTVCTYEGSVEKRGNSHFSNFEKINFKINLNFVSVFVRIWTQVGQEYSNHSKQRRSFLTQILTYSNDDS